VEPGAATDAEQDIALCLIFADQLVKKNVWTEHTSPKGATYAKRANDLINNIWNSMVEDGKYLKPGNSWGGKDLLNPGYFAPAFYRIFDEFEEQDHNWKTLIDECYNIITKSEGYPRGLIPDFTNHEGIPVAAGYNTYAESKPSTKTQFASTGDWEPIISGMKNPGQNILKNAIDFIKSPENANFFQMDGNVVPESDSFPWEIMLHDPELNTVT
jgi:endo-1,4-beta-D-glucanase Y